MIYQNDIKKHENYNQTIHVMQEFCHFENEFMN